MTHPDGPDDETVPERTRDATGTDATGGTAAPGRR